MTEPLTRQEERLIRAVLAAPAPFPEPSISRKTMEKTLALVDELRAEIIRVRGNRVLPFRAPARPTETVPPRDPAA